MSLRDELYRFYESCKRRIAPEIRYSQDLYLEELERRVDGAGRWLDVGCGHQLYPPWRANDEERFLAPRRSSPLGAVGLDPDLDALRKHRTLTDRVGGTLAALPFLDESFDVITANMVVEHLPAPASQFKEVARVLRPGGRFIFHTPNLAGYTTFLGRIVPEPLKRPVIRFFQGRSAEDVYPTFYRANRQSDIEGAAKEAGFEVEEIRYILSDAQFVMIPPLAIAELGLLRMLSSERWERWRTNLIVILRKTAAQRVHATGGPATEAAVG